MVHFNNSMPPIGEPDERQRASNIQQSIPLPQGQQLGSTSSLSSYLDSLSGWADENSADLGSNITEDLQNQIYSLQQSLSGQQMLTPQNVSDLQNILLKAGVQPSQDLECSLIKQAAAGIDGFVHGQLSSFDADVSALQKNSTLSLQDADALVVTPRAHLQSMVDSISNQVDALGSMSNASSSEDLHASLQSVVLGANKLSEEMQNTLQNLTGQMQKVQASIAVSDTTNVGSSLPYTNQIYDAVNNLYYAWYDAGNGGGQQPPTTETFQNSPQNIYMLLHAVSQFMAAVTAGGGSGNLDGPTNDMYNLLNTNFPGTSDSLASLAASSPQPQVMTSSDFSSFMQTSTSLTFNGSSQNMSIGQGLCNMLNGSSSTTPNSWFNQEGASGGNPYATMFEADGNGTGAIQTALSRLESDTYNLSDPPTLTQAETIAGDIQELQNMITAYQKGGQGYEGSGNLDGYMSYLQNYLNAPLDESGDSLLSLANQLLTNPTNANLSAFIQPVTSTSCGQSLNMILNQMSMEEQE